MAVSKYDKGYSRMTAEDKKKLEDATAAWNKGQRRRRRCRKESRS